jgi:hypothetical protein
MAQRAKGEVMGYIIDEEVFKHRTPDGLSDEARKALEHVKPYFDELTAERDELKKELAITKKALGLILDKSTLEDDCPDIKEYINECPRENKDCGECWIEHFINQAKEQL